MDVTRDELWDKFVCSLSEKNKTTTTKYSKLSQFLKLTIL